MSSGAYLIEEKESMGLGEQTYLREKNNEHVEYYYEDDSTMLISKKVVKTTIIILVVVAVLLPGLFISSIKGRYYKNKLDAANESKPESSTPEEKANTDVLLGEKENMGQTTIQDTTKPEVEISIQETDEKNEDQSSEEEFTPQKIGGKYLKELRPMVDSGTWNMGDAWWSPQYLNTGEEICYAIASSMSQNQDELTYYIGDQDFTQLTARYAWWNKYNTDKSLKAPAGACEIFADGESIWSSPGMDVYSTPVDIDCEIPSECKQLTIIFEGAANGILMDPKLNY